jgi:methionyl-tRNA formyltransferase
MNLVLFINGNLGLKVLNHLVNNQDHKVIAVVLNSEKKRSIGYLDEVNIVLKNEGYISQVVLWNGSKLQLRKLYKFLNAPTYGVSALFGHVLPKELTGKFTGGILNLHPSLLPIGRGANPVSWSIIDGQPQGISLHLIDQQLDAGDLIFQKEIDASGKTTAGEVYEYAMLELFTAFQVNFPKWIAGELTPYPQSALGVTFHKSSELDALRMIKEEDFGSFGDFIRRIQACTFSNGRVPQFEDNEGKIWEVELKMMNPRTQD